MTPAGGSAAREHPQADPRGGDRQHVGFRTQDRVEIALGDTNGVGPEEIDFHGPGGTRSTVTDRR